MAVRPSVCTTAVARLNSSDLLGFFSPTPLWSALQCLLAQQPLDPHLIHQYHIESAAQQPTWPPSSELREAARLTALASQQHSAVQASLMCGTVHINKSHASHQHYSRRGIQTVPDLEHQAHQQPAPNLKTALRRLYKRIHPDLFNAHPEAKVENERSFKLLQEYLHLARQGGRDSPASRVAYHFAFYLRSEELQAQAAPPPAAAAHTPDSQQQQDTQGTTSTDTQAVSSTSADPLSHFLKVDITLPPPADPQPAPPPDPSASKDSEAGKSAQPQKRLAGSVRKALTRLFTACGIQVVPGLGEVPASQAGDSQAGDDLGEAGTSRLSTFLPAAMEAQRLAKAANQEPAVRVANIRGAMRLQRKVLVSFKSGMELAPSQQVTHLTQLADVLDSLPQVNLEGGSIQLGDTSGIDKMGNLCLDVRPAAGGPELWRDLLLGVDMTFVRERKLYVQAVKQTEQRIASALGIKSVYGSPPSLIAEPTYRALLEQLAHTATTQGKIASGAFADVSICVMSAYMFHLQGHANQPTSSTGPGGGVTGSVTANSRVDSELAVLCVSEGVSAVDVYEAMTKLGPQVQASRRIMSARQQELASLTSRLRTALHLRHLTKHEQLSDRHYLAACKRLLELSDAISHITDGGSIKIGFVNRVWPDGSFVEMAHDFAL